MHLLTRLGTISRVYRSACARWVIRVTLLLGTGMVIPGLGGCGAPGLRATAVADNARLGQSGAVLARDLMGLGGPPRERVLIDPATGSRAGVVRTSSSFDAGVAPERGEGPGRWTVRTREIGDDGTAKPQKFAGHVIGPHGGVYLSWSRSVKDTDPDGPARLYVFEPALIWFPAAIEPGAVFEDTTSMTERDPDDEDKVSLRGKATRRVAIIDGASEAWPFAVGDRSTRAVVAELRVRVGPAEAVRRTTTRILSDGTAGDEFVDYGVRVLGVPIKRERSLVLAE